MVLTSNISKVVLQTLVSKLSTNFHEFTKKIYIFFRRKLLPLPLHVQLNMILKIQVLICGLFVKNKLHLKKLKLELTVR